MQPDGSLLLELQQPPLDVEVSLEGGVLLLDHPPEGVDLGVGRLVCLLNSHQGATESAVTRLSEANILFPADLIRIQASDADARQLTRMDCRSLSFCSTTFSKSATFIMVSFSTSRSRSVTCKTRRRQPQRDARGASPRIDPQHRSRFPSLPPSLPQTQSIIRGKCDTPGSMMQQVHDSAFTSEVEIRVHRTAHV